VAAAILSLDPVFLSRVQFGFVISFPIIFPAFTIGLAAWLATLEDMRLATGNAVYRRVFDFWLRVFAVSFGVGVVTGVVMAFQFGTNWGVLSERMGAIQGLRRKLSEPRAAGHRLAGHFTSRTDFEASDAERMSVASPRKDACISFDGQSGTDKSLCSRGCRKSSDQATSPLRKEASHATRYS
jgi:hypothetical protein